MEYFIDIHTHSTKSNADLCIYNLENYEKTPTLTSNYFFSAGIHPWFINNNWEIYLVQIEKLLSNDKISALGECGIDKKANADLELQKNIFLKQALMADKCKKPLLIHCVKAYNELFEIRNKYKISQPMILHGFKNRNELAKKLIKEGLYISFGESLLKNNSNSVVALKSIPKNRIFLETDNSDISIEEIYKAAAQILGLSIEELSEQIILNYNLIFKR